MKLLNQIKGFLKKALPKKYKQSELIELKGTLVRYIKNIENTCKFNRKNNDPVLLENLIYYKSLLKDQQKIKKAIARTNFLIGINNIIFNRETLSKELNLLLECSKSKDKDVSFFKLLKHNNFIIEDRISQLQNRLKKISEIQEKINNRIFSYSLLTLKTV